MLNVLPVSDTEADLVLKKELDREVSSWCRICRIFVVVVVGRLSDDVHGIVFIWY